MEGPCSHRHRAGEGEPLLLIHGIGSTWRVWQPVLPALERRHDVLAVSLPGYGESPPLEGEPTVPALADAVEQELDATGWETAHVVGNSLGGWIAAELARRGRARSVVAISPAGLWTPKELSFIKRSLESSYAGARMLEPYAETLTRSPVLRAVLFGQVAARGWRIEPEEAAYALHAMANSPSFEGTKDWVDRTGAVPEGLNEIRCPFRVVWGTWDFLLPVRQAPRWARLVPDAELVELPRLGHVPMGDDADLTARTILDFTTRVHEPIGAEAAA